MLQELQCQSDEFCRDHLAQFYQQFEEKNQQLSALVDKGSDNASLQAFVVDKRNKALFEQFESAYLAAIHNTFAEFSDFLQQRQNNRPIGRFSDRIIESELALPNMINAAEQRCEHEIADLNRRLSVVGQIKINTERNPFTPLSFAHAFEQAILSLHWNMQTRILAFRLFETSFLRKLGDLYTAMNHCLASHGILPNLKREIEIQAVNGQVASAQEQVAEATRRLVANGDEESLISAIPTPEICDQLEINAANDPQQDGTLKAIETVGRMFNDLLSQEGLNDHLKSQLSRLYTPYVRLAMSDEGLLSSTDHPAKRLLKDLSRAVDLCRSESAPLQRPALQLQIRAVVEKLSAQAELNPRVFSELAFRFSAELRFHDRLINAHIDKKNRGQSGLRQLDSLRSSIQRIVDDKLEQLDKPAGAVLTGFLHNIWVQYVTSLYARQEQDSAAAEAALQLVDRMLAYASGNPASSNDFTELAPQIRQAILACGGENLEVRRFLQQLMHQHKHPITGTSAGLQQNTALEAGTG